MPSRPRASSPASRAGNHATSRSGTTSVVTSVAAALRSCSAASRTGGVLPPVTIAAQPHSFPPSLSLPPSSSGCDQQVLTLALANFRSFTFTTLRACQRIRAAAAGTPLRRRNETGQSDDGVGHRYKHRRACRRRGRTPDRHERGSRRGRRSGAAPSGAGLGQPGDPSGGPRVVSTYRPLALTRMSSILRQTYTGGS